MYIYAIRCTDVLFLKTKNLCVYLHLYHIYIYTYNMDRSFPPGLKPILLRSCSNSSSSKSWQGKTWCCRWHVLPGPANAETWVIHSD